MLKKVINDLNDKSKTYFVNKLQLYDELIDAKNTQLESLNERLKEIEKIKVDEQKNIVSVTDNDMYYELINPSYKDETIFKNYKKIEERFNIRNQEIINKFISSKLENEDDNFYQILLNIREKITFNDIYTIGLMDKERQLKKVKQILNSEEESILKKYPKDNFNILKFKSYIDNLIRQNDPTIYIKVGDKNENYNHLNNNIKTQYDANIYKGIIIIYKNKLYDYSLS